MTAKPKDPINLEKATELTDSELMQLIKGHLDLKTRFILLFLGVVGLFFPGWLFIVIVRVFSSILIENTEDDATIILFLRYMGRK
jgi:hypothetical protein